MNRKRTAILLIAALMIAASLCACSHEREIANHEVTLQLGESVQLTLDKIPQGKTAADYQWDCGQSLSVNESGLVQANKMGDSYVNATLTYKGTEYFEYFKITVPVELDKLSLDKSKIMLLVGQQDMLTAETSVELPNNHQIEWSSSDEKVVTLERPEYLMSNSHCNIYDLVAAGTGRAVVTASCGGVEVNCEVNVYDPQTPDEIMAYLDDWQSFQYVDADGTACVEMNSAGISLPADGIEALIGTAPAGKYLVAWDYDYNHHVYSTVDKAAPNYDYTALLPPEYRPHSFAEVEYIIRVTDGEAKQEATYEHGVKGMRLTAVIVLENAATGEAIEILYSAQGSSLPQSIIVPEESIPEYHYGDPVENSVMENALMRFLGDLWLENHSAVLFHEGATVRHCSGSKVTLPDTISKVNLTVDRLPTELVIPASVGEILNSGLEFAEIKSITVYDGSFAQQWVSERERGGVTVLLSLSDN
jgi:hypothetical protein